MNRTDRRAVADVEPPQVREGFRAAMAQLAGGVVVVTTEDADGRPYGFTATSFCSVSMDPALVLVCLAETSSSYEAFMDCRGFAVSLLGQEQRALATRFATTGADKFRAEDTVTTPASSRPSRARSRSWTVTYTPATPRAITSSWWAPYATSSPAAANRSSTTTGPSSSCATRNTPACRVPDRPGRSAQAGRTNPMS